MASPERACHALHILVAAPGQVDEHDVVGAEIGRQPPAVCDRVRRLEGRQNALQPGEVLEGIERGAIVDPGVLGAPEIECVRSMFPSSSCST